MTRFVQNGLLISFAWAIGVIVFMRYQELPRAQDYATRAYFVCAERAAADRGKIDRCLENVDRDWSHWMNRKWGEIAKVTLIPIAGGWLLVLAGIAVSRRIPKK